MQEKFSYYLNKLGDVKEMDHFEALQIDKDFFDKNDEKAFKERVNPLLFKFHPDRNKESDSETAKKCFQRIHEAYETLKDPEKRKIYQAGGTKIIFFEPDPEFDFEKWSNEYKQLYKNKIVYLDSLKERIERLDTSKNDNQDSLEIIIEELSSININSAFMTKEREQAIAKYYELKNLVSTKAQTPRELYLAYILQKNNARNGNFVDYSLVQKSAKEGYLPALSEMLGGVFTNMFTKREQSVRWGLYCCHYLESIAITQTQDKETLNLIEKRISDLREAYGGIIPKQIPLEEKELQNLTDKVIKFINSKQGWFALKPTEFELTIDMFEQLDFQRNLSSPPGNYDKKSENQQEVEQDRLIANVSEEKKVNEARSNQELKDNPAKGNEDKLLVTSSTTEPLQSENIDSSNLAINNNSKKPSKSYKLRFNEMCSSGKTPKEQFLAEHGRLFDNSKKGIFGIFRTTNLDENMNLKQILQYAKENNNRSRQACINLGWMKKDGTLNSDNPNLPTEVSDAYEANENNFNRKG